MVFDSDIDNEIEKKTKGRYFSFYKKRYAVSYCEICGQKIYKTDKQTGEPYRLCYKCYKSEQDKII